MLSVQDLIENQDKLFANSDNNNKKDFLIFNN
jgi:hypothetical protein